MGQRPPHLLPLADLPIFISKGDILCKDTCIGRFQKYQNFGRAFAKGFQETLSVLTKSKGHKSVNSVVKALCVPLIFIVNTQEIPRNAVKQFLRDGFLTQPLRWLFQYIAPFVQQVGTVDAATWTDVHVSSIQVFFILTFCLIYSIVGWYGPGGPAWCFSRIFSSTNKLPTPNGPRGWPVIGSWTLMQGSDMHMELARQAWAGGPSTRNLMALSVGTTRIVLTSDASVAKEILRSAVFGERPLKQAALDLGFARAIGFASQGPYWRHLRKVAVTHMFCHRQIEAHSELLQGETSRMITAMVHSIRTDCVENSRVGLCVRPFLQRAAVNNIMTIVFGRHFDFGNSCSEAEALEAMIKEGFELLGGFNWADHLPLIRHIPFLSFHRRCKNLTMEVRAFVQPILDERRRFYQKNQTKTSSDLNSSFVDVLLSLEGEKKLQDEDIISILWEMVFRGTDTIAVLTEWALAEVILNRGIQARIHEELDAVVGFDRLVQQKDIENLPYLQAVLKETLRSHPPGPLLSWARLANEDTQVAGYHIPQGTTTMVNMWAITHDSSVWTNPEDFDPSRFLKSEGGSDFDVQGTDLRLAPFGSGRRVCPGRALGIATAQLWLARLLHHFSWSQDPAHPIDLTDNLKLSCEMATPLYGSPTVRFPL